MYTRRMFLTGGGAVAGAMLGGMLRPHVDRDGARRLRPPGALPEREFLAACTRCGQCIEVCPDHTLTFCGTPGAALGTPCFDPQKVPCGLCRGHGELRCIAVCPSGALRPVGDIRDIRIGTAVIDEARCLAYQGVVCRACWHACPLPNEAIRLGPTFRPVVAPAVCIGCGLCTRACPTEPTSIPVRPPSVA